MNLLRTIAFTLALLLSATPATAAKKVALVIGNASYSGGLVPLPNSRNDAIDVAAALRDLDFEVIELVDLDLENMRAAVDAFEALLQPGGISVFYFSGHGMQFRQKNYLVPVGVPMRDVDDVATSALPIDRVMAAITAKKRTFNLIILDACNDTGLEGELGGLARMDSPENTLIAFAAGVGQLASAGWDRNSVFTGELLTHLRTPQITVQEMLGRTRERVAEVSKFAPVPQVPVDFNALTDQAFFLTLDWLSPFERFKDCETCPEMIVLPAGSYMRGSENGNRNERPVMAVTFRKNFAIAINEVTFDEFDACVADGICRRRPQDNGWGRGNRPVINVSWDDTQDFIKWLTRKARQRYRLPTEAEWEYAARAGNTEGVRRGNWGTGQPAMVGSHEPNAWGLHDMQGNVFEWVEDCLGGTYRKAPTDGTALAAAFCGDTVVRGGSFLYDERAATVSFRGGLPAFQIREDVGFRIARSIE